MPTKNLWKDIMKSRMMKSMLKEDTFSHNILRAVNEQWINCRVHSHYTNKNVTTNQLKKYDCYYGNGYYLTNFIELSRY